MMRLAIALTILFAPVTALSEGASDNDLYAGYCWGVMESALGFVSAETKPVWVKRRDRFRRYLLAHTLNNDDALMGIAVAKRQGIANHRDCAALIKTCRSKCSTNEPNPC